MSYRDEVLKSRPSQYYTVDEVDGNLDLSGFGNDASAVSDTGSFIVPGSRVGSISGTIPNPLNLFSQGTVSEFTIEFWTFPYLAGSGRYVKCSYNYSGIRYDLDRFEFTIIVGGKNYIADFKVKEPFRPTHVVATMVRNSIVLIVNGEVGDPVALPTGFEFDDVSTYLASSPSPMAHFAVYNYALTIADIQSHYREGLRNASYREVCLADGADFYEVSSQHFMKAVDIVLSEKDFRLGNINNLEIDRFGNLCPIDHPDIVVYDASGVVDSPTLTGALHLSSQWAVLSDASTVLKNLQSSFGCYVTVAGAGKLFSIYNRSRGKAWIWSSDGSGNITLTAKTILPDDTETTTTYTYDTSIGTSEIGVGVVIEQTRVKFGTESTIIQCSGADWINEDIIIDSSTEFILGADDTYTGPAISSYADLYFTPSPGDTTSDMSAIFSPNNTCVYALSSDLTSTSSGTWTYTMAIPYTGTYTGHSLAFFPQSSFGITVTTDLDGFTSGSPENGFYDAISTVPFSGTLGAGVSNGPLTITVVLNNDNGFNCHLSHIDIQIFADNNMKAFGTSNVATIRTDVYEMSPNYEDPVNTPIIPTSLLVSSQSGIDLASSDVKSFEFVMITSGPGHIMSSPGDTFRMVYSTTGSPNIVYSGWDSVYVNGQPYPSGTPLALGSYEGKIHILATDATGYSGVTTVGAKHDGTDGSDFFGIYCAATYPDQLTASEAAEHYGAFTGRIVGQCDVHETLVLEQYGAPFAYSYAWQSTGAPQ